MTLMLDLAAVAALLLAAAPAVDDDPAVPAQDLAYVYQVEGRRDPFVRSHFPDGEGRPDCAGSGLARLLIGEVALRGIVVTRDGSIAMLVGPDGAAHFARVGDPLCDGRIAAIPPDRIVYARKTAVPAGDATRSFEVHLWPAGERPGESRR